MADLRRRVVLASASPRRRELLASIGIDVLVAPVDADESRRDAEAPAAYVERVAVAKLRVALASAAGGDAVLTAVAHQQDVAIGKRLAAVGAVGRRVLEVRGFAERACLPVRPADRPRDDVLEPAEARDALSGGFGGPPAVARLERRPAPTTALHAH